MTAPTHPPREGGPRDMAPREHHLACDHGGGCDGLTHRCTTCGGAGRGGGWRCGRCDGAGVTPCPVASAARILDDAASAAAIARVEAAAERLRIHREEREAWLAKMRLADGEPPMATESHRASAVVVAVCVVGVAVIAALVVILEAVGLWVMD